MYVIHQVHTSTSIDSVVVVQTLSQDQLCHSVDCIMPGSSVLHYLLGFAQIHVYWDNDAVWPSHSSATPFYFCLKSFPESGSFPVSWLSASGDQSIGVTMLPNINWSLGIPSKESTFPRVWDWRQCCFYENEKLISERRRHIRVLCRNGHCDHPKAEQGLASLTRDNWKEGGGALKIRLRFSQDLPWPYAI